MLEARFYKLPEPVDLECDICKQAPAEYEYFFRYTRKKDDFGDGMCCAKCAGVTMLMESKGQYTIEVSNGGRRRAVAVAA